MKKKVFIGLAWPYVNGDIHIGHLAGYLFPADIFARFHRYIGNDVIMVSGSDCFGTPITIEADRRKITPQEVVKEYHAKYVELLLKKLKLSFDIYTKTDNENHKRIVQDFFVKLAEQGLIFKDKTNQYYSPEEKRFLPDRYVEGKCPHCGYGEARSDQCENCGSVLGEGELAEAKNKLSGQPMVLKSTEHYFLDWPKLQPFLEDYVDRAKSWRPWILRETKGWLEKGLKPRSITRDLDWGVEIPVERLPKNLQIDDAKDKRIYVWFEAVIGYFSATVEWAKTFGSPKGKNWKDWWYDPPVGGDTLHAYFMGKDNLVFHTLFWPGELHGYDQKIHLPDLPVINQYLNVEGQKFSKSRGITIDSAYIVETYGLDTVKFYLTLIDPENTDTNFSWADFVSKNNNILIGNFGNFINRTLVLAKGLDFRKITPDAEFVGGVIALVKEAKKLVAAAEFKRYAETILALSDLGNKYLSKTEPWFLSAKGGSASGGKDKNQEKFKEVIANVLFAVLALLLVIKPLIPDTAEELSRFLGVKIEKWPEDELAELKQLLSGVKISDPKPLFRKLDDKVVEFERSKLKLPKRE